MTETFANAFRGSGSLSRCSHAHIASDDCILDLIDNEVDAAIASSTFDLIGDLLFPSQARPGTDAPPKKVTVTFSSRQLVVEDNCGGIPVLKAQKDVSILRPHRPCAGNLRTASSRNRVETCDL